MISTAPQTSENGVLVQGTAVLPSVTSVCSQQRRTPDTAGVKVQASRQVQTLLSGDATHPTQVGISAVIIVTITIIHPPHTRSLAFVRKPHVKSNESRLYVTV